MLSKDIGFALDVFRGISTNIAFVYSGILTVDDGAGLGGDGAARSDLKGGIEAPLVVEFMLAVAPCLTLGEANKGCCPGGLSDPAGGF
jgi:hypothetical protein